MKVMLVAKRAPYDPSQKSLRRELPKYLESYKEFLFYDHERLRFSDDNKTFNQRFKKTVLDFQPTHIFCWLLYLNNDEVDWCKQRGIKIVVAINGAASFSNGIQKSQRIYFESLKMCDYYLVPHAPHIKTLKMHGINAHEMPFFYDESVYRPLYNYQKIWGALISDLFFIGNIGDLTVNKQGQYRKDIISLLGSNVNIKVMSDLSRYKSKVSWRRPTHNEWLINWHQNRSKMILCMDYFPDINDMYQEINSDIVQMYDESYYYFIRPRTFYSMGSGTPVICEKHEEIKRFFSDGDNIILWDGDNILEKINYYLNNKNKLMELGLAGMETVRSFHTTEYRIKNIIIPALLGEL